MRYSCLTVCISFLVLFPDPIQAQQSPSVDDLLQLVATGELNEPVSVSRLPDLISVVRDQDELRAQLAIRTIKQVGPGAVDAIPILCDRLDDPSHALRDHAVQALVAIGGTAIPKLQPLLSSSSGRVRSTTATALHQLEQLDLQTAMRLADDDDARVRAVAAKALGQFKDAKQLKLFELIQDDEIAVAIIATQQVKRDDTNLEASLSILTSALKRPGLSAYAAEGLAKYGMDAQRTIPALIAAYPAGRTRRNTYYYQDAVMLALERIGPPHPEDVEVILSYLGRDAETASVAGYVLATFDSGDERVISAVERQIDSTLARYQNLPPPPEEGELTPEMSEAQSQLYALLHLFWHASHDIQGYEHRCEEVRNRTTNLDPFGGNLYLPYKPLPIAVINQLLDSSRVPFLYLALGQISERHSIPDETQKRVWNLVESQEDHVSYLAVLALIRTTSPLTEEIELQLLKQWEQKPSKREALAELIIEEKLQLGVAHKILEEGLHSSHDALATSCARAILATSPSPNQDAIRFVTMHEAGKFRTSDLAVIFRQRQPMPPAAIAFLKQQINDQSLSKISQEVLDTIGYLGKDGSQYLPHLQDVMNGEGGERSMIALKSHCQISGNLEPYIQRLSAPTSRQDTYTLLEYSGHLGTAGNGILELLKETSLSTDELNSSEALTAIQTLGTPRSIETLQEIANTRDWKIRQEARSILDSMNIRWEEPLR